MRTKSLVVCLFGLLLLFASSSNAEMRKWTRKNGKEFEAEFVKREGPVVTLKKPDGTEMTVRMPNLSDEDRKYVKQLTKGKGTTEPKEDGEKKPTKKDKKPADATWRMTGEYPSLAGEWVENEEGKRYVTITQDGNKFVGKSNVFTLGDKTGLQYRVEGTVSKSGRITGKITSSKDGHDENPGTMTGTVDPNGKTVRIHSKEDGGESDWTLTLKENQGAEPKHADKKKHNKRNKKPQADTADVAKKDKPAPPPEEPTSDQPKTMIVEAKGSGKDRDEALKDAFRDAIRKVVGAYVEEETVIKNDQVIKDQVLAYSGGCVKTHGILSEDSKDGVVQVAIWALVEQDKVVKHLQAASVSVRDFPGTEILDQLVTRRAKEKAAEAMLRSVFKGFPGNCVKVFTDGDPEEVKHDDRGATIRVKVRFDVDAEAFVAFGKRLQAVLHAIAEQENEGVWELEKRGQSKPYFYIRHSQELQSAPNKLLVFVNTQTTEQWDRMTWKSYVLDFSLATVFTEVARQRATCRLSLNGKEHQLIYPDGFNLSGGFPLVSYTTASPNRGVVKILGAYFGFTRDFASSFGGNILPSVVFPRDISLTDNQLQSLKGGRTECKIEFSTVETRKP